MQADCVVGFIKRTSLEMPKKIMLLIKCTSANTPSQYHNESVLKKYQDRLKVGTLKESAKL